MSLPALPPDDGGEDGERLSDAPRQAVPEDAQRHCGLHADGQVSPEIQQACGFTQNQVFAAYVDSLLPLAQAVEDLSPDGGDHPNPEYPWEQGGVIVSPLSHTFAALDLRHPSPQMVRSLKFIADCLTIA